MTDYESTQTFKANEDFFDFLESSEFKDYPPEAIMQFLGKKVKLIPFSVFLRRLIFRKAGFEGKVSDHSDDEYRKYLTDCFKENGVPVSFRPTSTKTSVAAKNWLAAATVSRDTILLLGFALKLSSSEVSDLLTKGIHESKLYFRNSTEAICSYCYDNGFPYSKMAELKDKYKSASDKLSETGMGTIEIGSLVKKAVNDDMLLEIIGKYHLDPGNFFSHTALSEFNSLYKKCAEIIAERKGYEDDEWDISALAQKTKITDSVRSKLRGGPSVSSSDIEKALNTGTPIDKNGNLVRFSDSVLCDSFRQKRMTRNHISDILASKEPVDRFDLLTMKFFIASYLDYDKPNNTRWFSFVEDCNVMLARCSMGQLYNANPYDVFLQMCMLTDVPMATYDDILEMSYSE